MPLLSYSRDVYTLEYNREIAKEFIQLTNLLSQTYKTHQLIYQFYSFLLSPKTVW